MGGGWYEKYNTITDGESTTIKSICANFILDPSKKANPSRAPCDADKKVRMGQVITENIWHKC